MPKVESFELFGESPSAVKLLRIFLASTIIDNGGSLSISRKAFAELSDNVLKNRGFQLIATPDDDHGMQLTLEWLN